jgi:hypothetical protein
MRGAQQRPHGRGIPEPHPVFAFLVFSLLGAILVSLLIGAQPSIEKSGWPFSSPRMGSG